MPTVATAKRPADQYRQVWTKKADKTRGGLRRSDLTLARKSRQVVSRRRQQAASKNRCLAVWRESMRAVKRRRGIPSASFTIAKKGTRLYKEIKRSYEKRRPARCVR